MVKRALTIKRNVTLPCVLLYNNNEVRICRSWNGFMHHLTENVKKIIPCGTEAPETIIKELQTKYNNALLTPIKGYSIITELAPHYAGFDVHLAYVSFKTKYKRTEVVGVFRNMVQAKKFVDTYYKQFKGVVVANNEYTKEYHQKYRGIVCLIK